MINGQRVQPGPIRRQEPDDREITNVDRGLVSNRRKDRVTISPASVKARVASASVSARARARSAAASARSRLALKRTRSAETRTKMTNPEASAALIRQTPTGSRATESDGRERKRDGNDGGPDPAVPGTQCHRRIDGRQGGWLQPGVQGDAQQRGQQHDHDRNAITAPRRGDVSRRGASPS